MNLFSICHHDIMIFEIGKDPGKMRVALLLPTV